MDRKEIGERIKWVPAWALSLFAALLAAFTVGFLNNYLDEPLIYFTWNIYAGDCVFPDLHPTSQVSLGCAFFSVIFWFFFQRHATIHS